MTSIFVAKLDFGVTEDELRGLFEQFGKVTKASIALDKETRKPRGFAFVEMADREEASRAIKELDGTSINGRQIAVKEADQKPDNRGGAARPDFKRDNRGGSFEKRGGNDSRPNSFQTDYKKPIDDRPKNAITVSSIDEIKIEPKKKVEKDIKSKDWDNDNKNKKPKMNAHKKSGKNNRFFDEDDEDWDIPYKSHQGEEDDEDEDDDFYSDEEE